MKRKIIIAVTGASGAIYAKRIMEFCKANIDQFEEIAVVFSKNAKDVWEFELQDKSFKNYPFSFYEIDNYFSPIASGSAKFDSMVIIPCSMGTLGRIAAGTSDDLIARSADVMLKERRKLVLVCREAPLNLIHIKNMKLLTEAGGIICPASPSFYSLPKSFEELADTVVHRILDLIGIDVSTYRWTGK